LKPPKAEVKAEAPKAAPVAAAPAATYASGTPSPAAARKILDEKI
jgi:2-oxoglutarate dehydrogenase E2 component (dihydrolipoamide succinyltransferase)